MKLYEFSYTDKLNQNEAKVLVRVAEFLEVECDLQGWAEGYSFGQCQSIEQLANGERRYHFVVLGKYEEDEGFGEADPTMEQPTVDAGVAASAHVKTDALLQ